MRYLLAMALIALASTAHAAWTYGLEKDQMGRGAIKWGISLSANTVNLNPPYQGAQRGSLRVRIHPEYGQDVVLSVGRGQFMCRVDGCSVLVRFDEGAPVRYSAVEPADRSSNAIFINNYEELVRGILGAKVMRIEAEFFRNGPEVFVFNVAGLKWEAPETPPARIDRMAQQMIMKDCNSKAGTLKNDERRQFMRDCVRAALAEQ